jgi:hypothetical protein
MQLLSVVLVLALTPKFRREFLRPGFWTLLLAFSISLVPPLMWNAQHGWVTVVHLGARGGGELKLLRPLEFIGAHLGVYSPVIFAAMILAIGPGWKKARLSFKPRFLLFFSLPLLAMYLWISLRNYEPNWTAPAFVSLGVLAAAVWLERAQTSRAVRILAFAGLFVGGGMSLAIMNTDALRALGVPWPYKLDPGARLRGWRGTAQFVGDFRKGFEQTGGRRVFLVASSYGIASELAFYLPEKNASLPGHPLVYTPESQAADSEYFFWPRYDEYTDLRVIARNWLAEHDSDPAQAKNRAALEAALTAIPGDKPRTDPAAAEPWAALTRALRDAAPELGLDEYYSEEEGLSLFVGSNALYITDRAEERPPSSIGNAFERTEMIAHVRQERRGLPLRELRIFACHNYRSLPL